MPTQPTEVLPDAEKLVIDFLRTSIAVVELVGQRVFWQIPPKSPTYPLVRVQRLGGRPIIDGLLDRARIQVESFGGSKSDASLIDRTIAAECQRMPSMGHDLGVVVGVRTEVAGFWAPDRPSEIRGGGSTERPRYISSYQVSIRTHPHQSS